MKQFLPYIIFIFLLGACKSADHRAYYNKDQGINYTSKNGDTKKWDPGAPFNIEEFRAAWVATVANISWPSKPGLPVDEQKEEALKLLDYLSDHNFNAVILQVRPQADALYDSKIEPWSYYLTGEQGKAPVPYYDPLNFWIDEAHKRGLELHAWLNPYRAHHTTGKEISDQSLVKTHPELVVRLENGMWWMDPAREETKKHSLSVVKDIVERYNVDGIHFDDYFYPYESYNNDKDFPDEISWKYYKISGGKLSKSDWRRENVNSFIKAVYKTIKETKPYVKFGISPFGIWRPGHPESVVGFDQYNKLYADAKLWLNKGYVDYFTPQLYWQINKKGQSFPELLGWWQRENNNKRHLWPGIKVDLGGGEKNADETINQIMITRGILPESKGSIHWSIGPLVKYDTLSNSLKNGPYSKKVLVPTSPWLDNIPPESPKVKTKSIENELEIEWSNSKKEDVFSWIVYFKYEQKNWDYTIINKEQDSHHLPLKTDDKPLVKIAVSAVDRTGNQSRFMEIDIQ
ncbi:family 10 glycosylhydrolase [Galbibacter sp. EGI 63066]|uniref:glycoside hydrolase family 10 protein n=1 Tax=Galbibacter sp. EGI 63066 TaxID=2993559 RepID=UPI0022492F06|nr:family 10 glycosylhydrolase [Galbibacter sp. EGI 63066]MCX2679266.1 family 10 glycosylhydrolase [Galbibacter sp. EGI 63066]